MCLDQIRADLHNPFNKMVIDPFRIGLMGFMGHTFLFCYNSIKEIRITNFEKKKTREHTFLPRFDFPINQGFKFLENKIFRDILSFL